ncbi:MAG: AAA family ATPase [Gemmatimonadota bacterium]
MRRRRELALVAYLGSRPGRSADRAELAALLWGERVEVRARQSLRQALLELKRWLADALVVDGEFVRLGDGIEIDSVEFETEVVERRFAQAAARWNGMYLRGVDDFAVEDLRDWIDGERARLSRLYRWALDNLRQDAVGRGAWTEAVAWAQRTVSEAPLDEQAHHHLLECLCLGGETSQARGVYAAFLQDLEQAQLSPSPAFLLQCNQLTRVADVPSAAPEPGAAAVLSPDLVGRGDPFTTLIRRFEQARGGRASVTVIEGEPGTGKTRLLQEFVRWARSTDQPLLVLESSDARFGEPVVGEAARRLLARLRTAPGLTGSPTWALADLTRLVPDIRDRVPNLPAAGTDLASLHDAVARVLIDVAAEVPLILVLDDLPRADEFSQQLFEAICRRLDADPIMVLASGRPDTMSAAPAARSIAELAAQTGGRIEIGGLNLFHVEQMLGSMLEMPPDERNVLAQQLHVLTGGTPVFMAELVAALVESGAIKVDGNGVWRFSADAPAPDRLLTGGIRSVVAERVARLPDSARVVLAAAATMKRIDNPDVITAQTGFAQPVVTAAMNELVLRQFLRRTDDASPGWEFASELSRTFVLEASADAPAAARPARTLRLRRGVIAAVLSLAVGLVAWHVANGPRRAQLEPGRIAIFPFTVRAPANLEYLGAGVVPILSASLDGAEPLRTVDSNSLLNLVDNSIPLDLYRARSLAHRFGAGLFLTGSVLGAGDRVQISAELFETNGDRLATFTTAARAEADLAEAIDELARKVIATQFAQPQLQILRTATVTTASVPALKLFLTGETALRKRQYAAAVAAYQEAIEADSSFALAHYRLSIAAAGVPDFDITGSAAQRAYALRERLPETERLMVDAYDQQAILGLLFEPEQIYRRVLQVRPASVEAWERLGELLFHRGVIAGRSFTDAAVPFRRVLALVPDDGNALLHLARIAAYRRDHAAFDSIAGRMRTARASEDAALEVRALDAILRRRLNDPVFAELDALPAQRLWDIGWRVATFSEDLRTAERWADRLTRESSEVWQAAGFVMRAHLLAGQDRHTEARQLVERVGERHRDWAPLLHALLMSHGTAPRDSLQAVLKELRAWAPAKSQVTEPAIFSLGLLKDLRTFRAFHMGQLALALDDSIAFAEAVRTNSQLGHDSVYLGVPAPSIAKHLRAAQAMRNGRFHDAILAQPGRPSNGYDRISSFSAFPFYNHAQLRLLQGDALRRLGRTRDAVGWYQSVVEDLGYGVINHATMYQRLEETYLQLGDTVSANWARGRAAWIRGAR